MPKGAGLSPLEDKIRKDGAMRNRKVINLMLCMTMIATLASCSFSPVKGDKKEDKAATATTEEAAEKAEPETDDKSHEDTAETTETTTNGEKKTEEKVEGLGQIEVEDFDEKTEEAENKADTSINAPGDGLTPIDPQGTTSNSDEEPDSLLTKGCDSSEKAIFTYWEAMASCYKAGFEKCIIGEKTVDEQYLKSIELKNEGFVIYYDQIMTTKVSDRDLSPYKAYGITDAKTTSIVIPVKVTRDGEDYIIHDCYDIITAQVDGVWFVIGLTETDVYVIREITGEDPSEATPAATSDVGNKEYELSESAKSMLAMTETDYNKVSWEREYAPFQDGTVFSTATYKGYSTDYIVVAITNLSHEPVSVTAGGKIMGADGGYVGEAFIYADCIGPMNTCLRTIYCDGTPSGGIEWTKLEKDAASTYSKYVPWEADWALQTNSTNGSIELSYDMTFNDTFNSCMVTGVALDSTGKVVDVREDYIHDSLSTNVKRTIPIYSDYAAMGVSDLALFANPVKNTY